MLIQTFTPESYWSCSPEIKFPGFPPVKFEWSRGRMFDKRVAASFRQVRNPETGTLNPKYFTVNLNERVAAASFRQVRNPKP